MYFWLVVYLPPGKICSSVGMIIPNIWKNKSHVPNHQPVEWFWHVPAQPSWINMNSIEWKKSTKHKQAPSYAYIGLHGWHFCQKLLNIQHTGTELMWMEHLSIRFNIGIVWEYSSYRLLDDVTWQYYNDPEMWCSTEGIAQCPELWDALRDDFGPAQKYFACCVNQQTLDNPLI